MTTFAADIKAWIKAMGYTRDQAAEELRVARSTLDGWCAGRPSAMEGPLRRLMDLLSRQRPQLCVAQPDLHQLAGDGHPVEALADVVLLAADLGDDAG